MDEKVEIITSNVQFMKPIMSLVMERSAVLAKSKIFPTFSNRRMSISPFWRSTSEYGSDSSDN